MIIFSDDQHPLRVVGRRASDLFLWLRKKYASILEEVGPQNSISSLDGVRAIACLLVVGYHINLITHDMGIWKIGDPSLKLLTVLILAGFSGVSLFFVLSGFLLFLPYARALLFGEQWPSMRLFYLRRVLRIVPAYYATLLLLLLFYDRAYVFPVTPQNLAHVALFLTFLMDSTKGTYQQIEGPLWTLAVEWQFYMLLPLLALGMRQVGRLVAPRWRGLTTIGCLCLLISWGIFSRYWGLQLAQNPEQLRFIPGPVLNILTFLFYGSSGKYLEDFAVGMLVSLCYIYTRHPTGAWLAGILSRTSLWIWGCGILALFGMAWWHSYNVANAWPWSFLNQFEHTYLWTREFLFSCGYGVCILAILFNPLALQPLFSWRPLRSLGKISFSLYMWHLPLLVIFMMNVGEKLKGDNGFLTYPLYWLYVLVVIVPFCTLCYGLCEKPGIKLAGKLKQRKILPPPPSVPEPQLIESKQLSGPGRQLTHLEA